MIPATLQAGIYNVKIEEEVISTIELDEITAEIVKAYLTYSKDIAAPSKHANQLIIP